MTAKFFLYVYHYFVLIHLCLCVRVIANVIGFHLYQNLFILSHFLSWSTCLRSKERLKEMSIIIPPISEDGFTIN